MVGHILLLVFPLLMFFAATSDLMTMRISNRLVGLVVVSFLVAAVLSGMAWTDLGLHFAAALLVLAGAFVLFTFGWVGGGDAKLAAATTLWVGFGATVPYLIYATLLGGALTLVIMIVRRFPLPLFAMRFEWITRLHNPKSGVPYGVALALAGVIVFAQTDIFLNFAA